MENITAVLSRFVAELKYESLPEQVLRQTKLFIADYYAACLAGYRVNAPFNEKVLTLMMQTGGAEEASVLFCDRKLPAADAAFMNAIYAHGADMDDGNRKAAGHIAAHVMSAVFAVAEAEGAAWKDVFVSINAGYEVFNRVVGAAQPGLYAKGFHSTGVGGGLACAAACAKLMGLDEQGIYNAISLSAIQASGLIIIDESGQCCKPINPANAARTGVISAQLARLGVESSRNPLESKKGWFNAFADKVDEAIMLDGLGESFTICESYLKLYPTCRHTHCCIDAALELRDEMVGEALEISDIESVRVTIYPSAIRSAGTIQRPVSADEAKFSIHYCIAAALTEGGFGLDQLEVDITPEVSDIISKIQLIPDDEMENRKAGIRGTRMDVTAKNGMVYTSTVLIPKGEAAKPLDWEDIRLKLNQCAGELWDEQKQQDILDAICKCDMDSVFSMPV